MSTRVRACGGLLAMAIATGVGATAAMGTAPAANATCASFFGLSSGPDCTSGFGSIAIAIGSDAIARANGLFGVALAVGDQSFSAATAGSVFTLASAMGTRATADVNGFLQAAISAGNRGRTDAGFGGGTTPQFGNIALNIGNHVSELTNEVSVTGFGNLGVNVGGDVVFVDVTGFLNNATNLFGSTDVHANGGALSLAFNVFGGGNSVTAGPGFLIVAGSLGQTFATITQKPFGININGAAIPSAATINPAAKHSNRTSSTSKTTGTDNPRKSASGKATAHSARG
jgi:hypothetical protein